MANATETTVERDLRDFAKSQSGTRVSRTIAALRRSDRDRVPKFWPASAAVQHVGVQGSYQGDEELCVFTAAGKYQAMRAVLGWVWVEDFGPMAGAWLTLRECVVDPAGAGRDVLGFYGFELRMVEAARWTTRQRIEVANTREVGGFRL